MTAQRKLLGGFDRDAMKQAVVAFVLALFAFAAVALTIYAAATRKG